jgi:drug/metabolite transporter (DMT)-like permease
VKQVLWGGMLLAVTAVWGWTFVLVKDTVAHYDVIGFLALRFSIAALLLGAFAWRHVTWRSLVTGGTIGLVLAAGYLTQTYGLRYTTAANSGLITGLFVVVAPVMNRLIFGVKAPAVLWGAITISVVGLYLLVGGGHAPWNIGDRLTLTAAAFFGLQIVLLDRYAGNHDTAVLAFVQIAVAATVFLILWPTAGSIVWPSKSVWIALAITAVPATAAAYWVQTYVQQRISAVATALILTMEPVFATLFACLLAGEQLSPIQVLGMVLMLGAVVAAQVDMAARTGKDHRQCN